MIPYKFHKNQKGHWDHTLLLDILTDPRFNDEDGDGGIYAVPGEYANIKEVNNAIKKYEWVILMVLSDERSVFPIEDIKHPNIKIYIQYPKQGRHDQYAKWPLGYTSETRKHLKLMDKDLDFFFSGQVTHKRRADCFEQIVDKEGGLAFSSKGFSQGMPVDEYMGYMNRAKTAPAPSGPICADSFRTYEALEAGAIPIADNISQAGDHDYWNYLFGSVPFPTINNYSDLPGYIEDQLDNFQHKANIIQAWWIKKKRDLKLQLLQDVADLTGQHHKEAITVVIPVSPIKSHPSTHILEETINSIRTHLNTEIIITFDGVRPEQEDRRKDYEEFTRRALFLCNTSWNAVPIIFDQHMHQSGMMQAVIDEIKTPLLMYAEHDTPITPDREIDFKGISTAILNGAVSHIRLSHEALILDVYKHLMLDEKPINVGVPIVRTIQYSQRPHVASVAFYRELLKHFSENSKAFLEDKLHSVVQQAYKIDGMQGWQNYRLAIYHPEGDIKRSYHNDGREGESKWDKEQIF